MDHFLKTSTVHKIHILEKSVRRVNNHPAGNMMCTKPAKALISRIYETGSMTKIKWFYMNIGIKDRNQPTNSNKLHRLNTSIIVDLAKLR